MKSAVVTIACGLAIAVLGSGCDRIKEKLSGGADGGAGTTASATGTASAPPGKKQEENLFAAGSGAMVVSLEPKSETNYDEWQLFDETTGAWFPGESAPKVFKLTLALPQPTTVKELSFQGGAKKITVEATASPQAKDGYQKIAEATLEGTEKSSYEDAPFQKIPVSTQLQARAYRITFELASGLWKNRELRAFGTKHADPAFPLNITGSYDPMEGSLTTMRVKQTGNLVSACVSQYQFTGEVEGGLVKGTWWDKNDPKKEPQSAAINVTPDGKEIVFLQHRGNSLWKFTGPKKAAEPGECPLWKEEKAAAPPVDPIAADIERFGRARIYGIKFDTDSDVPRPESKAVIDRVVTVLKAKPDWKITVEGHTDNTATPDYNQGLSDRRAKAVKKALETAGIAGARLDAKGLGQTKPIAPNETTLGRAENRRVELVKQ